MTENPLYAALSRAGELFAKKVKDEAKRPAVAARLAGDLDGDGAAAADLVIEAIIEDAGAKRALYAEAEPRMKPDALLATNTWPARQLLAPVLAKQVARKARREHYPAPYSLIETWRRSGGGIQRRLAAERRSVAKLAGTSTARNLIRVFFLQERLKKSGGTDHGIAHVHVVGAGVMGGDIAAWAASM